MLFKAPKVSQFRCSCGKLFHTRGAATENRRPPNTVLQRACLESMNGASALVGMTVVCQKGTVAGSAFMIENTMLTVQTGPWSAPITNASDEIVVKKMLTSSTTK